MRNDDRERRHARSLMVRGVPYADAVWMARVTHSRIGAGVAWGASARRHRGAARVARLVVLHCSVLAMRVHRWGWRSFAG